MKAFPTAKKNLKSAAFGLLLASPLTLAACTFKLGEPIRLYDSREEAKPKEAAPASSKSAKPVPSAPAPAERTGCVIKGAPPANETSLPEMKSVRDAASERLKEIATEAEAKHVRIHVAFAEALERYANDLGMPKPRAHAFVAALSSQMAPDFSPKAGAESPFAIQAWAIYDLAYSLADKLGIDDAEKRMELAEEMAGRRSNAALLYATYAHALDFAGRTPEKKGLNLPPKEARQWADALLARKAPAQQLVVYEEEFRLARSSGAPADAAMQAAAEAACFEEPAAGAASARPQ